MPSPDRPPLPPFAAPPPAPRLAHATIPVPGAPTTTVSPSAAMVINFYGYTFVVARLPETMWVATKYGPLLCTVRVPGDGTGGKWTGRKGGVLGYSSSHSGDERRSALVAGHDVSYGRFLREVGDVVEEDQVREVPFVF